MYKTILYFHGETWCTKIFYIFHAETWNTKRLCSRREKWNTFFVWRIVKHKKYFIFSWRHVKYRKTMFSWIIVKYKKYFIFSWRDVKYKKTLCSRGESWNTKKYLYIHGEIWNTKRFYIFIWKIPGCASVVPVH
jgi:hypothetical protein